MAKHARLSDFRFLSTHESWTGSTVRPKPQRDLLSPSYYALEKNRVLLCAASNRKLLAQSLTTRFKLCRQTRLEPAFTLAATTACIALGQRVEKQDGLPYLVRCATKKIRAQNPDWILHANAGDDLKRLHFVIYPEHGNAVVLKFSRVLGNNSPFDQEKAILTALDKCGIEKCRPRLISRANTPAGTPYTIESAIEGGRFGQRYKSLSGTQRQHICDSVCDWFCELAELSQNSMGGACKRVDTEFESHGHCPPRLTNVPTIITHNDPGSWNFLLTTNGKFGLVDWEGADITGAPLWDLSYFLLDVLTLDKAGRLDHRIRKALDILAGQSSSVFFWNQLSKAASRLHIPEDFIRPLLTASFMRHARSQELRKQRAISLGNPVNSSQYLHGCIFEQMRLDSRFEQSWGLT